jgi:hypothetical protein
MLRGELFRVLIYFMKRQVKAKLSKCSKKHQVIKVYEGVEVHFQEIFNLGICVCVCVCVSFQAVSTAPLAPRK